MDKKFAIECRDLSFSYEKKSFDVLRNLSFNVPKGARVLLLGLNGVGKSTLLRILSGRHMISVEKVSIFQKSPFHDPSFSQNMAFIDGDFPVKIDVPVSEILARYTEGVSRQKEAELMGILEVDPKWNLLTVSEGQRRRIDLLLSLRKKIKLLLLDEVTTHLDVIVRQNFLKWLRKESEDNGLTCVFATHIFDGLVSSAQNYWPTHVLFLKSHEEYVFQEFKEVMKEIKKMTLKKKTLYSPLIEIFKKFTD